jgi:glycosyltransferase involved in cell wall biosynthesis
MKQNLALKAERSGVKERVMIPGYLERREAEKIRMNAAAQIVPSVWYENAPLTVMEALSLGVPIIGSNIGGLPEMIGHEAGSEIFEPGDEARLSELITSLWNQRSTLGERSRRARRTYELRFTPEIHLVEYIRLAKALGG